MTQINEVESKIQFVLDGQTVFGQPGETVIQVADRYGIYIPRFCYHDQLSIAANCRMCLVQINQGAKTQPACHFRISEGIHVDTRSQKTRESQKAIMEFLLINHPLDCPVCDQGGQCDLQDLAMGFGRGVSRYFEKKRAVADEDLGSLVATNMTRCIHCTRCVRFGVEVAGIPELGTIARGEDMRILSYLRQGLTSELSGNVVDICPVGALTSKPVRFNGRSWSFDNHVFISAHDCIVSPVHVHTHKNAQDASSSIMRVVPRRNDAVNQVWLSDRDRFSFLALQHQQRLNQPMIRDGKEWRCVSWEVALALVAEKIQATIKDHGPEQIGALISPSASIEEGFMCQKLLHALGCSNMDYRHHQVDTDYLDNSSDDAGYRFLDFSVIDQSDVVIFVGSDIRNEQPIAAMRIRQAVVKGLCAISINPVDYEWHFECAHQVLVQGWEMITFLSACIVSLQQCRGSALSDGWRKLLAGVEPTQESDRFAKKIYRAKGYMILGMYAQSHIHATTIHQLCAMIESLTQISLVHMTPGSNGVGLQAIGFGPSYCFDTVNVATGATSYQMIDVPKKFYLLQQVELEYDHYDPQLALNALDKAHTVVAITSFVTEKMYDYADVLLPAAAWTEFSGTWVSVCGEMSSVGAVKSVYEASKSIWKIYRVLGNLLKIKGFSYHNISQLREDIPILQHGLTIKSQTSKKYETVIPSRRNFKSNDVHDGIYRVGAVNLYRSDPIVRRSQPLQDVCRDAFEVRIHPDTTIDSRISSGDDVIIRQGRNQITCPIHFDTRIAKNALWLPAAVKQTLHMAGRCSKIEIEYLQRESV